MSADAEIKKDLTPLQRSLIAVKEMRAKVEAMERAKNEPIAIVGMACRFPGPARDLEGFWTLLDEGKTAVGKVPTDRWDVDRYYDPDPEAPGKMYMREGSFLESVDTFDAGFFGISPREAVSMDPQQRLLMEVTWETLENAGIAPSCLEKSLTGVFVGIGPSEYLQLQPFIGDPDRIDAYVGTGCGASVASGRLSYFLGLRGPAIAVDTACSSSLVAIDIAIQYLRAGKCRLALAGGVNIMVSPGSAIYLSKVKALSPDGRCKTFDEAADGYGRGEGCGMIALKRLSDAQTDGDRILAVILGSAVNHDGHSSGLTVPNGAAQQEVIREALANAGIQPSDVDYIEAHGTGTSLGDPIEIRALDAVFGPTRGPDRRLIVGAVKTNIGHLEAAAGIAGVIKVVLAMQHGRIPRHLNLTRRNPHVPWDKLAMVIPIEPMSWPAVGDLPIAGVSSFGFSGTNAHVVLQAGPKDKSRSSSVDRSVYLLPLSARDKGALKELAAGYGRHLDVAASQTVGDICYTAGAGRSSFSHRLAVTAEDKVQLSQRLSAFVNGDNNAGVMHGVVSEEGKRPKIAFLFTGQGSQYVGMGRELYETEPKFRATMDACDEMLRPYIKTSLVGLLYPEPGAGAQQEMLLNQTYVTQPALFALEYSLAELWRSWGLEPSVVMGHSVGEYVAACVAGLFSLEDGIKLIAERGRLMQALPSGGRMAAVFADATEVTRVIGPYERTVSIAAFNGPDNTVVSGAGGDVKIILDRLSAEGIKSMPLEVSHAFHSPLMEPMLDAFEQVAAQVDFKPLKVRLVSNLTGGAVGEAAISRADWWRRHMREPVRFAESIKVLHEQGCRLFLEIGPHPTLLGMAMRCLPEGAGEWLPSLRRGHSDWQQMLESLGTLYVKGARIDWQGFDRDYARSRVVLPAYPFQRKRYWVDAAPRDDRQGRFPSPTTTKHRHPVLGFRLRSALKEIQYESQIGKNAPALLDDHQIYGKIVVPGAFHLSIALAAAKEISESDCLVLKNVSFTQAIVLPDKGLQTLQTILKPGVSGQSSFEIFSQDQEADEETAWTLHSAGEIASDHSDGRPSSPQTVYLEELQLRCKENPNYAGSFYQNAMDAGLQLGPRFRWMTRIWQGVGEAVGYMQHPETVQPETHFLLHPGLLDSCFQLLGAAILSKKTDDTIYVPVGVSSFRFYGCPVSNVWCHVVLIPEHGVSPEVLTANLKIFTDEGKVVAEVEGLHLKRAPREALLRSSTERLRDWLYVTEWKPLLRVANDPPEESGPYEQPGKWLIFADHHGKGEALARQLESRGEACSLVFASNSHSVDRVGHYEIDPMNREDIHRVFKEVLNSNGLPCRGIVHLWSLDSMSPESLTTSSLNRAQITGCKVVLSLVQMLAAKAKLISARLWIVTQGAQVVEGELAPLSVAHSPLWGLGRVIALEHPELWGGLVDLDPSGSEDELSMLAEEICKPLTEDHLAFRQGQRYVARLAHYEVEKMPVGPLTLNPEGTYLITGGLGALGIEVARRMVERGARNLVLMGRSSASRNAAEAIGQMETSGARVAVMNGDVSHEEDVTRILTQISTSMPPLRGIIHAAGVVDDGILLQQDWSRFEKVLAPKVNGAWTLHNLTRDMDLDFFVLFSSAASLLGNIGQGNYAAANAFLDGLAHHRRQQGLPAESINWGPWSEVGMAASFESRDKDNKVSHGSKFIGREQGLDSLEKVLQLSLAGADGIVPQIGVFPINWQEFRRLNPMAAKLPLLSSIMSEEIKPDDGQSKNDLSQEILLAVEPEERRLLTETYLAAQLAKVLKLPSTSLDSHQSIATMGFDSLMAVELRNQIERDLRIPIPMVRFLEGVSVSQLAGMLLDDLTAATDSPTPSPLRVRERTLPGLESDSTGDSWEEGVL